ncbi:MAG: hypothetical protein IJ083_01655 [Clostridia bacterium]|nr:hypothetical protein [Clostridia bacterium]
MSKRWTPAHMKDAFRRFAVDLKKGTVPGIPDEYIGVGNVILGYGTPEGKRPATPRKEDDIRKV